MVIIQSSQAFTSTVSNWWSSSNSTSKNDKQVHQPQATKKTALFYHTRQKKLSCFLNFLRYMKALFLCLIFTSYFQAFKRKPGEHSVQEKNKQQTTTRIEFNLINCFRALRVMSTTSPKSYFVLIGGETCDTQGADLHKREYLHTSLFFVAQVPCAHCHIHCIIKSI